MGVREGPVAQVGTPNLVPTTEIVVDVDVDGSDLRSELALSRREEVSVEQSESRSHRK